MKAKKLKVGDYVMVDGGGVAYCKFGKLIEITYESIKLGDVYKRERVDLYPGKEDVFEYEHSETIYITIDNLCLHRILKSEYSAIEKMYAKYKKIHTDICTLYRKIYFGSKK